MANKKNYLLGDKTFTVIGLTTAINMARERGYDSANQIINLPEKDHGWVFQTREARQNARYGILIPVSRAPKGFGKGLICDFYEVGGLENLTSLKERDSRKHTQSPIPMRVEKHRKSTRSNGNIV